MRLAGGLALPKAVTVLGLDEAEADTGAETIAGLVTAKLGHLPQKGNTVSVGHYLATVEKVARRRIVWLRFVPVPEATDDDSA